MNIVLITHKRLPWLQECLRSVLRSLENAGMAQARIFIGCNADPDAESWLKTQQKKAPLLQIFSWNEHLPPPEARNRLLKEIPTGWTLFLDDDTAVPSSYFKKFLDLDKGQAQIVGGPNLNFPGSSDSEELQQVVLGSILLSGPFAWRYSARKSHRRPWVSTFVLCHLWIEKKEGSSLLFDENLMGGEENELLDRLRLSSFLYHPDLFVYHHRRSDLDGFQQQAFKFGIGRGQVFRKKSPFGVRFFAPLCGMALAVSWFYLRLACAAVSFRQSQFSYQQILKFAQALHFSYLRGIAHALTRSTSELRTEFTNSSLPKVDTSKDPRRAALS
ncbi:MAG: glycosyltransferase [Bdellovibrionales bacterium]